MKRAIIAALAIVAGPARAKAGELPLETLALIDTAGVQERLELQASSFVSYAALDRDSDALQASLELELGVWPGVQVMVGVPFEHRVAEVESVSGLGSVEMGASAALLDSESLLLTAGAELALPASDPRIGEESVGGGPFLLGDLALGPAHLALRGGAELESSDELEIAPELGAAAYVEIGALVPALELAATFSEEPEVALAPGLFVSMSEQWELGVAGIVGLTAASPARGAIVVLTFEAELAAASEEDEP